jgi:hypothetical protein
MMQNAGGARAESVMIRNNYLIRKNGIDFI